MNPASVTSFGGRRHVIQTVATTAGVILIGLVSGIIAARSLGVDGRGELAAVILWPSVLAGLVELGLPTAFTYLSASRRRTPSELASAILPLLGGQSLLLYALGIPLILVVLHSYSSEVRATAVVFLIVYVPLSLAVRYLLSLSQGAGRMGTFNFTRLLVPAVYAAALVIMVLLGEASVSLFAGAFAASFAIALFPLMALSGREVRRGVLRPHVDRHTVKLAWSVGHHTYFGSLAPVDTLQLDVLMTTAFLGATEAGLYYVATSVGALVRTWGTTLGALSLPRVAASTSRDEAIEHLSRYARLTLALSGPIALVAFVFAGPLLVLVYGSAFSSAQTLVRILTVGMLAASIRYALGDGLRGLGMHTAATRAEMLGWLAGGVTLAAMLPLWGVNGVAAAVSTSYAATLIAMLIACRRLRLRPSQLLVPRPRDLLRTWPATHDSPEEEGDLRA